jgi:hypothetical protein
MVRLELTLREAELLKRLLEDFDNPLTLTSVMLVKKLDDAIRRDGGIGKRSLGHT